MVAFRFDSGLRTLPPIIHLSMTYFEHHTGQTFSVSEVVDKYHKKRLVLR
jgi:hypothetical protein